MTDIKDINPQGVYSLGEAAKFVPSTRRAGSCVHVRTLYRWVERGHLTAHRPPNGYGLYVSGAELLRLLHADKIPEWKGRTPAERNRACDAAMRELGLE